MVLSDLGPYFDDPGYDRAWELDESDPLREFRDHYLHTDAESIYLDGNSLGRLPVEARHIIERVADEQWGDRLVRAWNEGWWDLQLRLGDLLAPLLGAGDGEVIISDSTSVNLHKLADAAVSYLGDRHKIVTDDLNFPTDVYILDGIAHKHGKSLQVVASDGVHGPIEALGQAIDEDTALVALSHTVFKSGYTYDLGRLTAMAHDAGALIVWDCSHSVGALPISLRDAGVDLAVGCTYKYLNGGPGSPAFLYVRSGLQERLANPITAWWGHAEPFSFDLEFEPVSGIRRFHTGTMPILSLAAMEAGVSDVLSAGIGAVRGKSLALTEYLVSEWESHLVDHGFGLGSPRDASRRGSHVSFTHSQAWPVTRALVELGKVIPDFRTPDSIRMGLSPLYTRFVDVHTAVQRLKRIMASSLHTPFVDVTATVT